MPGGGIKKHETPEQAAIREVKEETGINIEQLDYLLGVYSNNKEGKRDTVYCFVVEFEQKPRFNKGRFNFEISDLVFANFDNLPEKTSQSTQQRLAEYLSGERSSEIRPW